MITLVLLAMIGWAAFFFTAFMLKRANQSRDEWFYFPASVRMSFPAKDAIARGMMSIDDQLLAYYFAPDGGKRMAQETNRRLRAFPAAIPVREI